MEKLFATSQRNARKLLAGWVESGLVAITDSAKKSRKYALVSEFEKLF